MWASTSTVTTTTLAAVDPSLDGPELWDFDAHARTYAPRSVSTKSAI